MFDIVRVSEQKFYRGLLTVLFEFDEQKSAQAAAHLIARNGGRMNYMVLIKLLYLTDRQSLIETGSPVTGDRMVSMPHGPVLSQIYDRINMGAPLRDGTSWYELISEPSHYEVSLAADEAPLGELSGYEIALLDQVYDKYGKMNKWALRDFTHTLPEWVDPDGSSLPIQPERILLAAGFSDEEIASVADDAKLASFASQFS